MHENIRWPDNYWITKCQETVGCILLNAGTQEGQHEQSRKTQKENAKWHPPPEGCWTVNMDARLSKENWTGIGAVGRDHFGNIHMAAVQRIPHSMSPLRAEATSMLFGLLRALKWVGNGFDSNLILWPSYRFSKRKAKLDMYWVPSLTTSTTTAPDFTNGSGFMLEERLTWSLNTWQHSSLLIAAQPGCGYTTSLKPSQAGREGTKEDSTSTNCSSVCTGFLVSEFSWLGWQVWWDTSFLYCLSLLRQLSRLRLFSQ